MNAENNDKIIKLSKIKDTLKLKDKINSYWENSMIKKEKNQYIISLDKDIKVLIAINEKGVLENRKKVIKNLIISDSYMKLKKGETPDVYMQTYNWEEIKRYEERREKEKKNIKFDILKKNNVLVENVYYVRYGAIKNILSDILESTDIYNRTNDLGINYLKRIEKKSTKEELKNSYTIIILEASNYSISNIEELRKDLKTRSLLYYQFMSFIKKIEKNGIIEEFKIENISYHKNQFYLNNTTGIEIKRSKGNELCKASITLNIENFIDTGEIVYRCALGKDIRNCETSCIKTLKESDYFYELNKN